MKEKFHKPPIVDGTVTWIYETCDSDQVQVSSAIVRGKNDIVIECKYRNIVYTIPLSSRDGIRFSAEFDYLDRGEKYYVSAQATLWFNNTGLLLLGDWIEGGEKMRWIAILNTTSEVRLEQKRHTNSSGHQTP